MYKNKMKRQTNRILAQQIRMSQNTKKSGKQMLKKSKSCLAEIDETVVVAHQSREFNAISHQI